MRKIFFLFAALLSTAAIAQNGQPSQLPTDPETKLITYTEVVNVAGVSKDELYKRAMAWFKKYYKNPADVIREKDSVNSVISGVHRFKITKTGEKGMKSDGGMV